MIFGRYVYMYFCFLLRLCGYILQDGQIYPPEYLLGKFLGRKYVFCVDSMCKLSIIYAYIFHDIVYVFLKGYLVLLRIETLPIFT